MMDDLHIRALCAFEEANLELDDGVAAINRIINNRMKMHFFSDGTVEGTVFANDQFSWTQWAMQGNPPKYTEVAKTPAEAQERAEALLATDEKYAVRWARALDICDRVDRGVYSGPLYDKLTDDTLLYFNPAISKPVWGTPKTLVCVIGHHEFHRRS